MDPPRIELGSLGVEPRPRYPISRAHQGGPTVWHDHPAKENVPDGGFFAWRYPSLSLRLIFFLLHLDRMDDTTYSGRTGAVRARTRNREGCAQGDLPFFFFAYRSKLGHYPDPALAIFAAELSAFCSSFRWIPPKIR